MRTDEGLYEKKQAVFGDAISLHDGVYCVSDEE